MSTPSPGLTFVQQLARFLRSNICANIGSGTSLARAQSWHEYCMGQPVDNLWITIGTTLACPKLAWVLHGVQHSCQVQSWHGFCMGCNIRANTRRAQSWHESCMRCNMCASVHVGMGFACVRT